MMPRKILFLGAALVLSYVVASRLAFVPLLKMATTLAQGQRTSSSTDSKSGGQPTAERPILGGDIAPIRAVADPYPVFDGIALDPANNLVAISDENHHSLLVYDRSSGGKSDAVTEPRRRIMGAATEMGFVAGVTMDPEHREVYTVNNDSGDQVTVYSYESDGNAVPARRLFVPHQSWGLSLALGRGELGVTTQELNAVEIYSRTAKDLTKPLREIVGMDTGLEDPHGIVMDERHNEIVVSNHGNWTQFRPYTNYDPLNLDQKYVPGRFDPASITVYPITANGNAKPERTIQGAHTTLNWAMGIDVDAQHDEIAVANYGDDSVLVFKRDDSGDAAPMRRLYGPNTHIAGPVGVAVDTRNNELWVANYGDHTALVFSRTDNGNVAPKRIVRNAPAEAATCGFTNASAASYDPKRGEILVPN
jgi:DNA-binding beta-propeller fold protein YncE